MILEPVDFLIFASVGNGHANSKDNGTKPWRSLGPSKIAFRLREAGYSVQVINFFTHFSYNDLLEMCEPFIDKHTVIGISTTFIAPNVNARKYAKSQMDELSKVIKTLKEKYNSFVILGGPSPKLYANVFNPNLVVEGYAENKIVEVANSLLNHGIVKKHSSVWDIKTCNHKWHINDCVMPGETLPIECGRGCIFKCKYCKFEFLGKKRGEYVRDLSLIKDEMIENYEKYNVTNYMLMDDTFNDDVYKLEDWCNMIYSLPFKVQYTAYCRADLLEKHSSIAKDLYNSGLLGSSIGIESFNPYASKVVGKAWSGKKAKEFLPKWVHEVCKGKSITQVNLIIGLPDDTIQDVWNWLEWMKNEKIGTAVTDPLIITRPHILPEINVFSDFDINAEKLYGYKFDDKNPMAWYTDKMTYIEAAKANIKMWDYIENNFPPSSWITFSFLSLGYTLDELLNRTATELYNDPIYHQRKNDWFNNYKNKLLGN